MDVEQSNVKQLAARLVDDIRRRGLRPGDRYLTASEAGSQFNASEISIHRAMQLLTRDDYLVRQRGSGTFIGSRLKPVMKQASPLRVVHVVMALDHHRTAVVPAETLISQLGHSMPEAVVEVHYAAQADSMRHLTALVERIRSDRADEGLILVRSSRDMQLYVADSGLPAIVFGRVYPGVRNLPWLDIDQTAAGRSMAQYMLRFKPRRLALVMRDDWRHGDALLLEGITSALGAEGFPIDALSIVSTPHEEAQSTAEIHDLLIRHRTIDGIMCRTHLYASAATNAARAADRRKPLRIIAGGGRPQAGVPYTCVVPEISQEEQVARVGRMLLQRAVDPKVDISHEIIPVHVVEPGQG